MTWPAVLSAALTRLTRSGFPACGRNCHPASAGDCRSAQPMSATPTPDVTARIAARSERVCNRSRAQAARYRAVHLTLGKATCSEGDG